MSDIKFNTYFTDYKTNIENVAAYNNYHHIFNLINNHIGYDADINYDDILNKWLKKYLLTKRQYMDILITSDLDCITVKILDKLVKLIDDNIEFICYLCEVEHYSLLCYMLNNTASSITYDLVDYVRENYGDAAAEYLFNLKFEACKYCKDCSDDKLCLFIGDTINYWSREERSERSERSEPPVARCSIM